MKEWEEVLKKQNLNLKQKQVTLHVKEEDGCYSLDIHYQNGDVSNYADGYYENELPDLIYDAYCYAKEHAHNHDNRSVSDTSMNAVEKNNFEVYSKAVADHNVLLNTNWRLTWEKKYSSEVCMVLSSCAIMDGDKEVFSTHSHDDIAYACMEIGSFLHGVDAVLAIEQKESIENGLQSKR